MPPQPLLLPCTPLRYSAAAGVRNRGDYNFGMFDYWLLDEIATICSDSKFPSPVPEFVSLYSKAEEAGGPGFQPGRAQ